MRNDQVCLFCRGWLGGWRAVWTAREYCKSLISFVGGRAAALGAWRTCACFARELMRHPRARRRSDDHNRLHLLHSTKQGSPSAISQHSRATKTGGGAYRARPGPGPLMAAARSLAALAAVLRGRQEQVRQLQEDNYLLRVRRGLFVLYLRIHEEMAAHKVKFGAADGAELQQQVEALRQDAGCVGVEDEQSALAVFAPLRDYLEWWRPGGSMLDLER